MKKRKTYRLLAVAWLTLFLLTLPAAAIGGGSESSRDAIIDNMEEATDRAALSEFMPNGDESRYPGATVAPDGANGTMGARSGSDPSPIGEGSSDGEMSATSRTVTGIILSIIIALAILVLILVLVPKSRKE